MNNVIICEGSTDLTLIQYFMEISNNWRYKSMGQNLFSFKSYRNLVKNNYSLLIGEVGGCGKIIGSFSEVIERNKLSSSEKEVIDNIVIVSDRDEINTIENFDKKIKETLDNYDIDYNTDILNDEWIECKAYNSRAVEIKFQLLLLIIPFGNNGALETFLLDSISSKDKYEEGMIIKIKNFVDNVDPQCKYLNKRRHITKAKFDVYFSIRTPLEQFAERRNILRGVPWEKYEHIQATFVKLKELG